MTPSASSAARPAERTVDISGYPRYRDYLPTYETSSGRYSLRFARTAADLDEVLRLRFQVFNLELGEGLDDSYRTGRDTDVLDPFFHHLMIMSRETGEIVGTYRVQTAEMAHDGLGFYSAGEFRLEAIPESVLDASVEIGRACVASDHRNGRVLHLLWKGLAAYLSWNRKRFLFGCCSLPTLDPAVARAAHRHLVENDHMHPSLLVEPQPTAVCGAAPVGEARVPELPALFLSYLRLGARVCGPPAIDGLFKTTDFLVMLDCDELDPRVHRTFFPAAVQEGALPAT